MGLWLRAALLSRIRAGRHLFPLLPALLDHFRKKKGICWEMVSLKPNISPEFLEFGIGLFVCLIIPGISRVLARRGI